MLIGGSFLRLPGRNQRQRELIWQEMFGTLIAF
jgi:hypothetical protein